MNTKNYSLVVSLPISDEGEGEGTLEDLEFRHHLEDVLDHVLRKRELLATLDSIQETVMVYPSTGGRPRARRMLTEQDPTAARLYQLFGLAAYAPPG
jgi:hypothetical protein